MRTYPIGQVSSLLGVKPYILRYWEEEIPFLSPRKSRSGRRAYTEREVQLLLRVRHLLYEQRYTIEGARNRLWAELNGGDRSLRSAIAEVRGDLLAAWGRLRRQGKGMEGRLTEDRPAGGDRSLIERFTALGQGHLFEHWKGREESQRSNLLRDLAGLDPRHLRRLQEKLEEGEKARPSLQPLAHLPRREILRRREAEELGRERIRAGRTAFLTVAGGQGSRLGFDGPKGAFPVSPIRRASLFQLFAEKALAAGRRYGVALRWYIMTSPQNHAEIAGFFRANGFFGLDEGQVLFFPQGMNPSLTPDGRLLLAEDGGLFQNPDGHGGVVEALRRAGYLEDMRERGIEELFYFQVDNPLVRAPDPLFLGIHLQEAAEVSSKVIPKRHPGEKLGVVGLIDGRPGVIEYSDLSLEQMQARDGRGELLYGMGSIAIHILNAAFLAAARLELPLHVARKKVRTLQPVPGGTRPVEREAVKLEKFIFDAIPLARNPVFYETVREEEFAPLKNREGEDSIETCVQGCIERDARWLEACGVAVPRDERGRSRHRIEISPLAALEPEALKEKLPASVNRIDGDFLLV